MSIPIHDALLQVFDVEHGGCSLLTRPTPGGVQRLMIDCGRNTTTGFTPGGHLRKLGANHLQWLAITNYDEDHADGFPSFAEHGVSIGTIAHSRGVAPSQVRSLKSDTGMGGGIAALIGWLEARPKAPLPDELIPGVRVEYFANSFPDFDDENNLSLVVHLSVLGFNFLYPGDMECAGFEKLLADSPRFRALMPGVHVLMASHHGRENGTCPAMFDVWGCNPSLIVISDSEKVHGTQETTNYYAMKATGYAGFRGQLNRKVLSTRKDGEIRFSFRMGDCFAE